MSFFSFGREGERGEGTFGSRGASDACPLALFTEAALSLLCTVYSVCEYKGVRRRIGAYIGRSTYPPRSHGLLSGPDDEGMGSSLSGRPRRFFLRVRYAVRGPMIDTVHTDGGVSIVLVFLLY